jgi:hypothetical protein
MSRLAASAVLACALAACTPVAADQRKVNLDARIAAEFTARVNAYMDLHTGLENKLPKLSNEASPEEILRHQRALERMIADARRGAKPGDLFTREIRALFRRYLAAVFAGPDRKELRASIMDENPGPVKITVNQRYPDEIPLATMPPQVLEWLPKLPEELEYRFIGNRLILMDVHAHLVVDVIENALPR